MPWHERKLVGELENRTVRTEQGKLTRAGKFLLGIFIPWPASQFKPAVF